MDKPSIGFNIFLNKDINDKCNDINECKSVERVLTALLYYQKLNKTKRENSNAQSIFTQLLLEAYTHYLDDITHLISRHESELESTQHLLFTQSQFVMCNIDECLMSDRHSGINDGKNGNIKGNKNDLLSGFHEQTWDNIHFYLVHLFEIGLRQRHSEFDQNSEEWTEEEKGAKDKDEWHCFDKRFKQERIMIETKRKRNPRFGGRFKPVSNKFMIQTGQKKTQNPNTAEDETFLDSVLELVSCVENIERKEMSDLFGYIAREEFDSESITEDMKEFDSSNIFKTIHNKQLRKIMYDRIQKNITANTPVFSTEFTFFYWKHFGDKTKKIREQMQENRNDYGGYSQVSLYIAKGKYTSLKEEVLTNNDSEVGIAEYDAIVVKTQQYITTQRVKEMRAKKGLGYDDIINFDLKEDEPIQISHLKSVICYTDYSKLSNSFTRTFRRIGAYETLESVKQRNRCYWHMSKLLIEAVNCFGIDGNEEKGPFFTGMGVVIPVPRFRIRLCGPTSTTKEILVSQNFAKENDIILELDNTVDFYAKKLRFFNASWLSRYKEENERIFVHGQWSIQISSIRLTANWSNFGNFLVPLSKFDAAISGGDDVAVRGFRDSDRDMIRLLFEKDPSLPQYITDTFKMFTFYKKSISLYLYKLIWWYPSALQNLIMEKVSNDDCEDKEFEEYKDNTNLLKCSLVDSFPNLSEIVLDCTNLNGLASFQFSLFGICDILTKKRMTQIKVSVYGVWKDRQEGSGDRRSWLYYVYSKISSDLKKKYKDIRMSIEEIENSHGNRTDLLVFDTSGV